MGVTSGYGSGDGDGYGDGYGYGYGDGYGYGSGDGYGYGYGSGSGYGDKAATAAYMAALTDVTLGEDRAASLRAEGKVLAWWRSNAKGRSANHGYADSAERGVGTVEDVSSKGPLAACTNRALHASMTPQDWRGERLWVVALYPPVLEDTQNGQTKLASQKREILAEIPNFLAE